MRIDPVWALGRRVGVAALDFLLPPTCMRCDRPVAGACELCPACFARCTFIVKPICARCGVPFGPLAKSWAHGGTGGVCEGCVEIVPTYGKARAALRYDAESRPLVLAFKYSGRTELARLFAPMMARAGAAMLAEAHWLVPVPLHRGRLRERGYNQAGLLCREVGRVTRVKLALDGLARPRRTVTLGELDQAARAAVMRGAIAVRPHWRGRFAGQNIVVVDDVMTSGATVNACAAALLEVGAARVDVLVVARVPDPRGEPA